MAGWVPQPGGGHPGPGQDPRRWSPQAHTWMWAGPKGPRPDLWPPFGSLPPQGLAVGMWHTHGASSPSAAWARREQQAALPASGEHPAPRRRAELTPPVCLEQPPARARGAAGSSLAALPLSCVFTGRLAGEWAAPTPGDNAPPGGRGAHTSTFFLRFQSCLHVAPGMCLCGAKLPSDKQLPANPSDRRACPSSLTRPLCGSSSLRFDPKTQKSVTSDSL